MPPTCSLWFAWGLCVFLLTKGIKIYIKRLHYIVCATTCVSHWVKLDFKDRPALPKNGYSNPSTERTKSRSQDYQGMDGDGEEETQQGCSLPIGNISKTDGLGIRWV